MMSDSDQRADEVDEYLWPLTGSSWAVDWVSLNEELQIRCRLAEILSHVREVHVAPRLRRFGAGAPTNAMAAVAQSIIEGPAGGPCWAQTLRAPVPRALRDEWHELAQRLRTLTQSREVHARAKREASY